MLKCSLIKCSMLKRINCESAQSIFVGRKKNSDKIEFLVKKWKCREEVPEHYRGIRKAENKVWWTSYRKTSTKFPAKIYDIRPHQQGRCGGSLSGDGSQDDLGDQIQWWWWTLARRRGRMFWRRHHTMSSLNENSRENYIASMESHYSNDRVISLEEKQLIEKPGGRWGSWTLGSCQVCVEKQRLSCPCALWHGQGS